MKYNMAFAIVCVFGTVCPSASEITVDGDGLELIAEYELEGDKHESRVINEQEIEALSGSFPFKMFYSTRDYYLDNTIIYFDENGDVSKTLSDGDEPFEGLFPVGNEGYYIRAFRTPISLEGWSFIYELYDKNDNKIISTPSSGELVISPSSEFFVIDAEGLWDEAYRRSREKRDWTKWLIYDTSGSIIGEIYEPTGNHGIETFENGIGKLIAGDVAYFEYEDYPEGVQRGTKIFDISGNLLFTLNDNTFVDMMRSNYNSKFLLGSESYICQLGFKSALHTRETEPGRIIEVYDYSIAYNNTLEVYNVSGDMIWSYNLPTGGSHGGSIFISNNEEYLCLVVQSENKIYVFETANGALVSEIDYPGGNPRRGSFISDDGRFIVLGLEKNGTNIVIIEDDNLECTISLTYPRGDWEVTGIGDNYYILVGDHEDVSLYGISN
jgi:hypothetical protein